MLLRDLTTIDEFRRVEALEKLVWGYTDAEDVVPVPIFVVSVKRGGILIGAFDDHGVMVGFVYSLAGLKSGRPMQWSHMLGVLDPWRNSGLGYQLKLAQRDRARAMGLDLIEWTFDPMQALNAHFNFRKLGIVVEEYEENIYGDSSSPLHRGTPTDRFVAEWWIAAPRRDRSDVVSLDGVGAPVVNRTTAGRRWRVNERIDLDADAPRLWVEIPMGFTEMQIDEPTLASAWRFGTRQIFTTYLARGYRVVDFALDRQAGFGRYLLTRRS